MPTTLSEAEAELSLLNRALRLLNICNTTLVRATNENQLLHALCRLMVENGGYLMAWAGVAEQDAAKTVKPVAQSGYEDGYLESIRITWDGEQVFGQGPTGTALRTGTTQKNQNCLTNPKMAPWREAALKRGYQSTLALPLKHDNQVLGALTLYSALPNAFSQVEVELLEELAGNMAYGLKAIRTRVELDNYRKHLEQRVLERTETLERVAENTRQFIKQAPISIAMFDRDMNYLACSDRWLAEHGRGRSGLIGCNHYEAHPDLPERWKQAHQQGLAGMTVNNNEDLWVQADGSRHWLRWSVQPWTDTDDKTGGIIISSEDITAYKKAEELLQKAANEATKANNAKSCFLAAASHDLRQPLTALGFYAHALQVHISSSGQPLLANLTHCVSSLRELLTDLLDLSKLEAGVAVAYPSDFALSAVLDSLSMTYTPEALGKGLSMRFRPSKWMVRTDPVLFQRMLGNLIANAIRYTDRGGVLVGCRQQAGKLWVEVWDTGIGFPEDQTSLIFEEFRQLGDGTRNHGSGLGLAIVARSAALLGLAIRVRSREGRGSLFALELPLGTNGQTQSSQNPSKGVPALCIALVDDSEIVRDSMNLWLQQVGHKVIAAASGAELQAKRQDIIPDICVVDYNLAHGETGIEVIESLRAALGSRIPAIILTGDTDPKLGRSLTEQGVVVLHKPVDIEILEAKIVGLTFAER